MRILLISATAAMRCATAIPGVSLLRTAVIGYTAFKFASSIWTSPEERITIGETLVAAAMEARPSVVEEMTVTGTGVPASIAMEQEGAADVHRTLAAIAATGNTSTERARASIKAFYRHWIARVRVEFPLRADRASDRAAMSKWLGAAMRAHGIRYTHMADAIPKVVAMAINPSRSEIEAEQWADHSRRRTRGEGWLWSLRRSALAAVGCGPSKPSPPGVI